MKKKQNKKIVKKKKRAKNISDKLEQPDNKLDGDSSANPEPIEDAKATINQECIEVPEAAEDPIVLKDSAPPEPIEDIGTADNPDDIDYLDDFDEIDDYDELDNLDNLVDIDDFDTIDKVDKSDNINNVYASDDFQTLKHLEYTKHIEETDDFDDLKYLEDIEHIEDSEDYEDIEATDDFKDIEYTEALEDYEYIDDTEDIEDLQDAEDIEYIEILNHKYKKNNIKKKKNSIAIIIVVSLVVVYFLLSLLIVWVISLFNSNQTVSDGDTSNDFAVKVLPLVDKTSLTGSAENTEIEEIEIVDPEIDWDALISNNPDVYGYVYVPGTRVSYPILQNAQDDFYLTHDENGRSSKEGSIYTNSDNEKNFDGSVTVLYGHNMRNGNMFGSLKEFYQEDFYREHQIIMVYTPNLRLKYQIICARRHSDAYLYDEYASFSDDGMKRFVEMATKEVASKDMDVSHVTDSIVNINDKFIVLSVCIGSENTNRYLVIGKLISEEEL